MIDRLPTAVVCDMDGLLVDSERLERRVWQAVARELGVELTDERFGTFVGHGTDVNDRQLRTYYGPTFDIPAFRARCHARMRELVAAEGVPLRPGARAWLDFVASLGIPLALATSSRRALVDERLGDLLPAFAAIVTRDEVARGKPHPDLYLEAATRLRVSPAACLALEDSPTGARAAIAAGIPVVLVPDLVHPDDEVIALAAGIYESLHAVRDAAAEGWGLGARG